VDQPGLETMIRQFQKDMGIPETGVVNPQTALMLTGSFLSGVPTLQQKISGLFIIP
jgi:murein L,D-transpeptidase YcbB/YkuD